MNLREQIAELAAKGGDELTVANALWEESRGFLRRMSYELYLQTEHWRMVRTGALSRSQGSCHICGATNVAFHVHHRTYERRGCEWAEDVVVLCDSCHGKFHEKLAEIPLGPTSASEAIAELYTIIDRQMDKGKVPIRGLGTGFIDLDDITAGLQSSELVIVASRPSVGKTTFAMNLARTVATGDQGRVHFVSLEASRTELMERLLCCHAMVDSHRVRKGHISSADMGKLTDAADALKAAPLTIDDRPSRNILQIANDARRLHADQRLSLLIVDNISIVEPANYRDTREQQVAFISRKLKSLARELGIPVIALAQLNRGAETRGSYEPRLSDLRDSGAIEQDADTVMLLHRPEMFDPGQHEGIAELIVAKQRNGPTGKITLTFIRQFCRFENFSIGAPFE